jgi:hypothetical protein
MTNYNPDRIGIEIRGALSVTALLDIEAKYNELRLHIDGGDEITHKAAVERVKTWIRVFQGPMSI